MADDMTPEQAMELQKQNCIFCKIVSGAIPSRKVFEDDKLICVLDIFPSTKSHLLLLTKEHYPFLPLIPVPLQMHMFRMTKAIVKAAKSAMVTEKATVFIANGAVAGQQSPHFLYHIIPRENNDGLDNFIVPGKDIDPAVTQQLVPILRQRLGMHLQSAGLVPKARPKSVHVNEKAKEDLAQMIYSNPQLKEMIMNDPDGFKKQLELNPELSALFTGVDIDKLSEALKKA